MTEYLTVTEAAKLLRTPVATLYQWSYRMEGPSALKVGRRLLYNRDDLLAWVESKAKNSASSGTNHV